MNMKKQLGKNKSFTLVELMIAIMILAGSIVSIAYSYIVFTGLIKLSKDVSFSTRAASAKLEDIRSENFYDVDSYNNQVFYPNSSDIYPQDIRSYDLDYRGIVYVDTIPTELKQVTVIICWKEGQRTIGEDWVFESNPDPSTHSRPASPVTITTYVAER